MIHSSEFMNLEIRITSNKFCNFWNLKFRNMDHFNIKVFCQADRMPGFYFAKTSIMWWALSIFLSHFLYLQSSIDLLGSLMLLLATQTIKGKNKTAHDGLLGDLECGIWNTRLFLWGALVASTWNLVCLTLER